jgi:stage IV sporulation protein B
MLRGAGLWLMILAVLPLQAEATRLLVPVGKVIGLQLQNDVLTVAAYDDVFGETARSAGLKIGDEILEINGCDVSCAEDVRGVLKDAEPPVTLTVRRGSKVTSVALIPKQTENGPRMGVYLRQGVTGIGTVTWYDPDTGRFGSLGHGVHDAQGELVHMTGGRIYPASVLSVVKGKCGQPGQLRGTVDCPQAMGELAKNTQRGVFGSVETSWEGTPVEVADRDDARTGPASIRSTVSGKEVREYSVEILKIYPEKREEGRNMLIRVTDPALLETTGGIVQGMSGSPIIQNGKLIGAVTHVLVNDPTTGYGIFIENMLEAAA